MQDLLGCAKTPAESLLLAAPGRQPLRQQPLRDAAGAVDPEAAPGAEGVPGEARRRVRRARRLLRRVRRHPRPLRGAAGTRLSVVDTADGTCSKSSLCWFTKCRLFLWRPRSTGCVRLEDNAPEGNLHFAPIQF